MISYLILQSITALSCKLFSTKGQRSLVGHTFWMRSLAPVVWDRPTSSQQTAGEPRLSQLMYVENKTVRMATPGLWGPVSQETDAPVPSVTIWGTWRRILVIFRRCTFIGVLREIRKSKKKIRDKVWLLKKYTHWHPRSTRFVKPLPTTALV